MNKQIRFVILFGLVVVGGFLLLSNATLALRTTADHGTLDAEVEGLKIKYTILFEEDGNGLVLYDYAHTNQADVKAAAQAMENRAAKFAANGTPFQATIVFAQPLSPKVFRRFMKRSGLATIGSVLRGVDEFGQAVTLGVPPVWERDSKGISALFTPVPANDQLDSDALARLTTGSHPVRVIGVVSTDVTLDQALYEKIKSAPQIYAIDVMQQVILDELQKQSPNLAPDKVQIQGSMLYANMETTGLAPKVTP